MTMRDCPNGEMRDQLPLYVSGRLDEAREAFVEAHLRECADCSAEVELLRATVRAFEVTAPDAAAIAAYVPTARAARRARPFHSQPLWRVAAAITIMIAGTAMTMLLRQPRLSEEGVTVGVDSGTAVVGQPGGNASGDTGLLVANAGGTRGIALGGSLSGLTDSQLEALLASLERLDGAVSAEPEVLDAPIIPAGTEGSGRKNQ